MKEIIKTYTKKIIKFAIFDILAILFIVLCFMGFFAYLDSPKKPNSSEFRVINASNEVFNVEIILDENSIFNEALAKDSKAFKHYRLSEIATCELIYSIGENATEKHKQNFQYKATPSSYYIILSKENQFILETVPL